MSTSTRDASAHRGRLRHPAEVPFYIFMVVLNVLIVATIIEFAVALPFLPDRIQESGWGSAIRSAFIARSALVQGG